MSSLFDEPDTQNKKAFMFKTFLVVINPSGPLRMSEKYREFIGACDDINNYDKESLLTIGTKDEQYDPFIRHDSRIINAIQTLGAENAAEEGHEIRLVEVPTAFVNFYRIGTYGGHGEKVILFLDKGDYDSGVPGHFMDCVRKSICFEEDDCIKNSLVPMWKYERWI